MVRSKGERTAMWVVVAVVVIGLIIQLLVGGFGQLATFRFWFALYGWLALGLIVAYPVYLVVSNDEDAVAGMAQAGAARGESAPPPAGPEAAAPAAPAAQR